MPIQRLDLFLCLLIVKFRTMKKILSLIAIALLVVACDSEENSPEPNTGNLVPSKMEDLDGSRELIYDISGKVSALSSCRAFQRN